MSFRTLLVLTLLTVVPAPATATWSVVAVDGERGEVGLAAASCSTGVRLIAGVVPGKGVVASQAATSFAGRDLAIEMLTRGERATAILEALGDEAFYAGPFRANLEWLQYGVATLHPTPSAGALTGASVPESSGADHGDAFSIQGNTLRPKVVEEMARAWRAQALNSCRRPLAERLLRTLEAGRDAGGDNRCPVDASSLAAFLIVAQPDDAPDVPSLAIETPRVFSWPDLIWHMLAGYTPDPTLPEPVSHLRELHDAIAPGSACPE